MVRYKSLRDEETPRLFAPIGDLFQESCKIAESPMVSTECKNDPEWSSTGMNSVTRLMTRLEHRCRLTRRFVATTNSNHTVQVGT